MVRPGLVAFIVFMITLRISTSKYMAKHVFVWGRVFPKKIVKLWGVAIILGLLIGESTFLICARILRDLIVVSSFASAPPLRRLNR